MLQTLFHIPHEIGGWPVFGRGWAILAWAVFSAGLLSYGWRRYGRAAETWTNLPALLLVGLAIVFVLPALEVEGVSPDERDIVLGLPIRGYGTMLLIAILAGLTLATVRARQVGLDPDALHSLAFWIFVWAIVGARTFYVIQKWEQFRSPSGLEVVIRIVKVTEGGLVVYGALLGAAAAGIVFLSRHNLPALAVGDLIAPSLALGLSIGRIGCLMNGCCYGGVCDLPWKITFPHKASAYSPIESPLYEHQHALGLLHGIRLGRGPRNGPIVQEVLDPSGPAARAGLRTGDRIQSIDGRQVGSFEQATDALARSGPELNLVTQDGRTCQWSIQNLPPRSRPVHPTQIYSSLNAALIFVFLLAYYPFRRRDGEVFALLLTMYPLTRFLLEVIRTDESAIFGTAMTISQIVSLVILTLAIGLWIYILRQPTGSVLSTKSATA